MYKVGDLVSFDKKGFFEPKSSRIMGVIVNTLSSNHYVDVLQTDGIISFRHVNELELIIESGRSNNVEMAR